MVGFIIADEGCVSYTPKIGKRKVSVQYRRVIRPNGFPSDITLQEAIAQTFDCHVGARKISDSVALRKLDVDDSKQAILNSTYFCDQYTFGQIVMAMPGGLVPLLAQSNGDVSELAIRQDEPAKGHDYMPGLLYFLAVGDHLMVAEGHSVRTGILASFMTWFLGAERGGHFSEGEFRFDPKVAFNLDGKAKDLPVSSATFKPDHNARVDRRNRAAQADTVEERTRILGEQTFLDSTGRSILEAVGAKDGALKRLMGKLGEGASLEVIVQVRAKVKNRKVEVDPSLINDLFSVSEADQVVLNGPEGQRIGEAVRLKHDLQVKTVGSLVDRNDMERALWEAYRWFHNEGRI